MALRKPVFKKTDGPSHIKSQEELDKLFARAEAASAKAKSADALHALDVYNRIVADGKHVKEFATDPEKAAQKLGLKLSDAQVAKLQEAHRSIGGAPVADTVELVAVAIIVLVLAEVPDREVLIDSSGRIKA